jgi:hypothetical protein
MANIFGLHAVRFDTRIIFGGCLMNIDGETYECVVEKGDDSFTSPTYTVKRKDNGQVLCTFRPWHLYSGFGRTTFQIKGVSASGGDGTLIVPEHGMLDDEEDPEDVEDGVYTNGPDALAY